MLGGNDADHSAFTLSFAETWRGPASASCAYTRMLVSTKTCLSLMGLIACQRLAPQPQSCVQPPYRAAPGRRVAGPTRHPFDDQVRQPLGQRRILLHREVLFLAKHRVIELQC